jgi:RimJ/RimL family protein N-acetyltransferase
MPDPMMDTSPYTYDFEQAETAYNVKTADPTRQYFAITHDGKAIGVLYLKKIDSVMKSADFGIALTNNTVKGKGYGTEAITLLMEYVFDVMEFETLNADALLRNTRSQHVLEKAGMTYTHEDAEFKYYTLDEYRYKEGTKTCRT